MSTKKPIDPDMILCYNMGICLNCPRPSKISIELAPKSSTCRIYLHRVTTSPHAGTTVLLAMDDFLVVAPYAGSVATTSMWHFTHLLSLSGSLIPISAWPICSTSQIILYCIQDRCFFEHHCVQCNVFSQDVDLSAIIYG